MCNYLFIDVMFFSLQFLTSNLSKLLQVLASAEYPTGLHEAHNNSNWLVDDIKYDHRSYFNLRRITAFLTERVQYL